MLKYLRIAVTALSLMACVLLIALWVRSYRTPDFIRATFASSRMLYVNSLFGRIDVVSFMPVQPDKPSWKIESFQAGEWDQEAWTFGENDGTFGFLFRLSPINKDWRFMLPHWFLVAVSAVSGIVPWIQLSKRFSLRTLLIATTLVAVGLGIIAVSS
jgi:hypothetical protein